MLKALPQTPGIIPILGKVQLTALWRGHTKSSDKAVATLSRVANESEVNSLVQWATWAVAKEQEHENKFDAAQETYKASLTRKDNPVVKRCYALSLLKGARASLEKKDLLSAEKFLNALRESCKSCKIQLIEAENLLKRFEWERYLNGVDPK